MKKIISRLLLIILTVLIGGALSIYLFKDQIINRVVSQVNTYLSTPVQVEKIDIDFFHGFPNVAVRFKYVFMESDFGETLLDADEVHVLVSPMAMINGSAQIESIEISDATINLVVDKAGEMNYLVVNLPAKEEGSKADFDLKSIKLKNVDFTYIDERTPFELNLELINITGRIKSVDSQFNPTVKGNLIFKNLLNKGFEMNLNKEVQLQLNTTYTSETQVLDISASELNILGTKINVAGNLGLNSERQSIDLSFNSPDATISILTTLLSGDLEKLANKYKSQGEISLNGRVAGPLVNPEVKADFFMKNVELSQPDFEADIDNLNLEGTLAISRLANLKTGRLIINKGTGMLENKEFEFSAKVTDFVNPDFEVDFNGRIGARWLANIAEYEKRTSVSGEVLTRLSMVSSGNGKNKNQLLRGNLKFVEVNFKLPNDQLVSGLNGDVAFAPELISLTDLSGFIGESDFALNGEVVGLRNYTNGLSGQNARLRAQLRSSFINLDEISAGIIKLSESGSNRATESKLPDLEMHLEFLISSLEFKKFKGSEILGRLNYKKEILEVDKFSSQTMGGKIDLSGLISSEPNGDYYIESFFKTQNIYLDSLFYVFNNFQQDFITDKYLKGQVNSEVLTSMYFDKDWRLRRNLLTAESQIRVQNGELNNFRPIMELSRYLDDREDHLDQLRFAELTNYINVRDDTVFIPEMNIKTNVRDIKLAGSHTLTQHIDYRLVVPVINENIDNDEIFGAVERIENASPNLHFKIHGTTQDYKVSYDLGRAIRKAVDLLDLKKTFKKREEKMDSVALDEEEFDWEY